MGLWNWPVISEVWVLTREQHFGWSVESGSVRSWSQIFESDRHGCQDRITLNQGPDVVQNRRFAVRPHGLLGSRIAPGGRVCLGKSNRSCQIIRLAGAVFLAAFSQKPGIALNRHFPLLVFL